MKRKMASLLVVLTILVSLGGDVKGLPAFAENEATSSQIETELSSLKEEPEGNSDALDKGSETAPTSEVDLDATPQITDEPDSTIEPETVQEPQKEDESNITDDEPTGAQEPENNEEELAPAVNFTAEDITVVFGTENFDLLQGISAVDEKDQSLETTVIDNGGFDVSVLGEYTVSYCVNHPVLGEVIKTRTITVVAGVFEFSPQPPHISKVYLAVWAYEKDPNLNPMPKWEQPIADAWVPAGYEQVELVDELTGVTYFTLQPAQGFIAARLLGEGFYTVQANVPEDIIDFFANTDKDLLIMLTSEYVYTGSVTLNTGGHNYHLIIDGLNANNKTITNNSFSITNTGTGTIGFQNVIMNGSTIKINESGTYAIDNVTFQNISTAAAVNAGKATVNISNSIFNQITNRVKAILTTGTVTVTDTAFSNFLGQVIVVNSNANLLLENCLFSHIDNTGGGHGSGIYIEGSGIAFTARNCTFQNMISPNSGYAAGAVITRATNVTLDFEKCAFINNSGLKYGAGISVYGGTMTTINVNRCYFEGNKVTQQDGNGDGGAIGVFEASGSNIATVNLNVIGSTFVNNSAVDDGGAIFVQGRASSADGDYPTKLTVKNSTFYGNSGTGVWGADTGGAVQLSLRVEGTFTHNTFYNNSASLGGRAIGEHKDTSTNEVPRVRLYNNLFVGASNIKATNLVEKIGNVDTAAANTAAIFGSGTPEIKSAGSAGAESNGLSYTHSIPTLMIKAHTAAYKAANAGKYADGAGDADYRLNTDQRGVERGTPPAAGATEPFAKITYHLNNGGTEAVEDELKQIKLPDLPQVEVKAISDTIFSDWLLPLDKAFLGWGESASAIEGETIYQPLDVFILEADTNLYARWGNIYTVTFDSQGGSAVGAITGIVGGSTIAMPQAPVRSGYTFSGWYKEAAGTTLWDFEVDTVTANVTLYAGWVELPTPTPDPTEAAVTPTPTPTPTPTLTPTPTPSPIPEVLGSIIITVVDEEEPNIVLPGSRFDIFQNNQMLYSNLIADSNGKIEVGNLPLGIYELRQTYALENYIPTDNKIFEIAVGSAQARTPLYLTVTNRKAPVNGSLVINKVDSVNRNVFLSGAVFSLYRDDVLVREGLVTNAEGQIHLTDIPWGTYSLRETKAPEGYRRSRDPQTVYIAPGQTTTLTVTNREITGVPGTGDSTNLMLYIGVMVGVAVIIGALAIILIRKKGQRNK